MAVSMKSANPPRKLSIGPVSMEWQLVEKWCGVSKIPTLKVARFAIADRMG
jgi:hypothetical protein